MFKRLFGRKQVQPERGVFRFHDGQQDRTVDPLRIWRDIWTSSEIDLFEAVDELEHVDAQKQPEVWFPLQKEIIDFVRDVFHIKPVEDGGLTEVETKAVLEQYLAYMADVKKKLDPSPTSLPPTDSHQAPDSTEKPTSA